MSLITYSEQFDAGLGAILPSLNVLQHYAPLIGNLHHYFLVFPLASRQENPVAVVGLENAFEAGHIDVVLWENDFAAYPPSIRYR